MNNDSWPEFLFGVYWLTTSLTMRDNFGPGYRNGHINSNVGTFWAFFGGDPVDLPMGYSIRNTLPGTLQWAYLSTHATFPWIGDTLAGRYPYIGNFYAQGTQGYIGVRFYDAVCDHFGWIQFRHDTGVPPLTQGTIIDWAYEDTCNAPILAGDTVGAPAVSVPTLNQWGTLILIALLAGAGTLMLKKQEQA